SVKFASNAFRTPSKPGAVKPSIVMPSLLPPRQPRPRLGHNRARMVSLDFRTRTDDDIRAVAARPFFDEELPALIHANGMLAAPGARELGIESFTMATPSGTWTLALTGDEFTVSERDDGAAYVQLSDDDVQDVVNDLKTPMTFLTGGALRMVRGDLGD